MTVTDRRYGVLSGLAMKAPCRLATTANITLSGLQSIDGVTTAADDRVLVKDQSDATENGIYVASSSTWSRATDFDSGDEITDGTCVFVASGSTHANSLYRVDVSGDITIDTTSISFSLFVNFDGREILAANRTYYVRTDGSDSNTGLTNTSGGAFLTVQKAVDTAASIDFAGFTVTIEIQSGTYTGTVVIGPNVGQADADNFIITGASATETDFVISVTSNNAIMVERGAVTLKRFKVQTTTSGHALRAIGSSVVKLDDVNFGAVASSYDHISVDGWSHVEASAAYTVSGAATSHISVIRGHFTTAAVTVTISGTPAFTQFAYAGPYGHISVGSVTWSGSATGSRFKIDEMGSIDVGSGSTTALPGDAIGTITAGGGGRYLGAVNVSGIESLKFSGVVTVSGGTPTLESPSYNIASITDTATGRLTVTIADDFADVHYTINATVERAATALTVANLRYCAVRNASQAVGSFEVECWDGTATTANQVDPAAWHVSGNGTLIAAS